MWEQVAGRKIEGIEQAERACGRMIERRKRRYERHGVTRGESS
jgi:hypothetical protein